MCNRGDEYQRLERSLFGCERWNADVKYLGVKPRDFVILRRNVHREAQRFQSPQAWIRPLPDLLGSDGRCGRDPAWFHRVSHVR